MWAWIETRKRTTVLATGNSLGKVGAEMPLFFYLVNEKIIYFSLDKV